MKITTIKTKIFKPNQHLSPFIFSNIKSFKESDILVITSKIVALSEGRVIYYWNKKIKEEIIKKESTYAVKTKHTWLTIKDNQVMAGAGIDESNANGALILLPKDSFKSAQKIRNLVIQKFKLKNFGVIITDSRLMPLRSGVVGVSLGYAGFKGLRDYRGKKDMFDRKLVMTQTDVADALATASVLCMGEGSECQPLSVITNAPVSFINKINKKELLIDIKDDIYTPLFTNFLKDN
jgi:coenzyme F420-0:L-glutamate ligase